MYISQTYTKDYEGLYMKHNIGTCYVFTKVYIRVTKDTEFYHAAWSYRLVVECWTVSTIARTVGKHYLTFGRFQHSFSLMAWL